MKSPPQYGSKIDADHCYLLLCMKTSLAVKELKMFQYRLSRILQLHYKVYQVEEGCLQLIFQVTLLCNYVV